MSLMFWDATSFNRNIGSWNIRNIVDMKYMFWGATSFNQEIGSWNTGNVQSMINMFLNASSFNQDIGSWNTSNVRSMDYMFFEASSFDQNVGGWNVENIISLDKMFENIKLSIENYDSLLIGWNNQSLPNEVDFGAGELIFCSDAAKNAHANMIFTFNWSIADSGGCEDSLDIVSDYAVLDENTIQLFNIEYTDPDFNIPVFSITGGEDMSYFNVDSITGELSFIVPQDYENSNDTNKDNIYLVEVTAVDNGMPIESDVQTIKVYVNNLNENLQSEDFVATWHSNWVRIVACPGYDYNYNVDWDNDGVFDEFNITTSIDSTFPSNDDGRYTIRLSGQFPCLSFSDFNHINSVDQWGSNPWESVYKMFDDKDYFVLKAHDTPNLFNLNSLSNMFYQSDSVGGNLDTGNWIWRTPTIKNLYRTFYQAESFNKDISSWDVSNVTNMVNIFREVSLFNQDIGGWDTSSVLNMEGMFSGVSSFNQGIGFWNTSNVIGMRYMFKNAFAFNQNIGDWNVERASDFYCSNTLVKNYALLVQGFS